MPTKYGKVPPLEAIQYFKEKKLTPAMDYKTVWGKEHRHAFSVARATSVDVMKTIRGHLDKSIKDGVPYGTFKKNITKDLQRLGWWGGKLGSPRRLRTIFDSNFRVAMAAGAWEKIDRQAATHPNLEYNIGPSQVHRPEHVTWQGTVLPINDPFWTTHDPPNGYLCKCWKRQVSKRETERLGGVSKRPSMRKIEWENKKTGEKIKVPIGIQPGWDHNHGKNRGKYFDGRKPGGSTPGPTSGGINHGTLAQQAGVKGIIGNLGTDIGDWKKADIRQVEDHVTAMRDAEALLGKDVMGKTKLVFGEMSNNNSLIESNVYFKEITVRKEKVTYNRAIKKGEVVDNTTKGVLLSEIAKLMDSQTGYKLTKSILKLSDSDKKMVKKLSKTSAQRLEYDPKQAASECIVAVVTNNKIEYVPVSIRNLISELFNV